MRRSERISRKRTTIECITITDSEDDDVPLPRQERIPGPPLVRSRQPPSPGSATSSSYDSPHPNESYTTGSTRKLSSSPEGGDARNDDVDYDVGDGDGDGDDGDDGDDDDDDDGDDKEVLKPPRRVPVLTSSSSDGESQAANTSNSNLTSTPGKRPDCSGPSAFKKLAALENDSAQNATAESRHRLSDAAENIKQRATRRRLVLDRIVGAVNADGGVEFVVKWKGLEQVERVPLDDMRKLFPHEVLTFMCQRIKWRDDKSEIPRT